VAGPGHVRGHFAHLEVEGDEIVGVFNDLAAGHHRAGDFAQAFDFGVGEKLVYGLAELPEIAGSAFGADSGTSHPPGVDRTGSLVQGLPHLAALVEENRLEGGGTDIDSEK